MKQKINELEINGTIYVPKDEVKKSLEVFEFTGEKTVASVMIGKYVIVRSRNEGINVGEVELADDTGIVLKNARRLYYHRPKDKSLSWYEGVAQSGISDDSRVSGTIGRKVIIEDYSMTEILDDDIYKQILNLKPNEQN
jgi:hypothetical protein